MFDYFSGFPIAIPCHLQTKPQSHSICLWNMLFLLSGTFFTHTSLAKTLQVLALVSNSFVKRS